MGFRARFAAITWAHATHITRAWTTTGLTTASTSGTVTEDSWRPAFPAAAGSTATTTTLPKLTKRTEHRTSTPTLSKAKYPGKKEFDT